MEQLIARYGLFAIFLGAGIEGEPFALLGGVLAHRQWLSPIAVAAAAIAGSCLIDQFWFHCSRYFRQSRLVAGFVARPAFGRSLDLIARHPVGFVLLFRFAYGLRAVATVALGASRISTRLFVVLNLIAAAIWGLLFTGLGYALGPALQGLEARYGFGVAAVSVGASVLALVIVIHRGRR